MKISVIFSKRFFKDAKKLRKKYQNIDKDLWDFTAEIESGKLIGDKLKSTKGLSVYKARVKNSSLKSGKSAGFRAIYYAELENTVYFIAIYSKSEQENISAKEILDILKQEGLN